MAVTVRTISTAEHLAYIESQPSVSFLQTPAWGQVKREWHSESIGWFDADDKIVGAGLVLYRQLPKIKKYLAYLPEGPSIDWHADDLGALLRPLADHARKSGAFGVRIGAPVVVRRWAPTRSRLRSPTSRSPAQRGHARPRRPRRGAGSDHLIELGWQPPDSDEGFAAGQPRFVFQLPIAGKSEDSCWPG